MKLALFLLGAIVCGTQWLFRPRESKPASWRSRDCDRGPGYAGD